jgi:hypothetical protein
MPLGEPGMKTVLPEMFMLSAWPAGQAGGRDRLSGDPRSLVRVWRGTDN